MLNDTFGEISPSELAQLRATARKCARCGMLATVDPQFHASRYGHAPVVRDDSGNELAWSTVRHAWIALDVIAGRTAAQISRDNGPGDVPAPLAFEACIICGHHCDGTTRGQIGDTSGAMCTDCAHWYDGNVTSPVCRACALWEWDGAGELPFNPDAGACARCGGNHAELYSGCCATCYGAGYREACARPNCRRG